MVSGQFVSRILDLVLLLILSRLLTPDDFGLIALALAPILIGEAILELPLVQALLRFEKPTKSMYDTAFTLSVLRGLALAIIFIALSLPLAKFYSEPRLTLLVCALAVAPILRGTISPMMVTFMQRMDFKREVALGLFGKLSAFIVATLIAISTKSYWAIAAATITTPLAMNLLSYILAPYRPALSLSEWKRFSDMVGWNSVAQILAATSWQFDRIFLGRFIPTDELGRYSLADDFVSIPQRSFVAPLYKPLMASFTRQKSETDLQNSYQTSLISIFILFAPVMLTLSVLAEPIVLIVLGEKWHSAAPIVQGLALISLIVMPTKILSPLALSLDRTKYMVFQLSAELSVKLPAMILGIYYYGVWGAIAARALAAVAIFIATVVIVKKLISLSFGAQTLQLFKYAICLFMMAAALYITKPEFSGDILPSRLSLIGDTILSCGFGGLIYLVSIVGIWHLSGRKPGAEQFMLDFLSKHLNKPDKTNS